MSTDESANSGPAHNELGSQVSSRHFKPKEFACPHCGRVRLHPRLLEVLEQVRLRAGGRPIVIRSGYRCPEHNRAVGGVVHSQHLLGRAADIGPGYVTPSQAEDSGARGVGVSGAWAVHIDVREGPRARWYY